MCAAVSLYYMRIRFPSHSRVFKFRRMLETQLNLLVKYSAGGPFCCYFFGWEDYVLELRELGLDPAVQGVPVKKKTSVCMTKYVHLLTENVPKRV